jgi:MFS family permease
MPSHSVTQPADVRPAFAVLVAAMLPAVLDQTILSAALPVIAGRLGAVEDVSYVVTAYVLTATVSTPLWGKLGDRHGRRGLLAAALTVFLGASALCGLAGSLDQLIAARAVQGIAAGGLMALAMASVGDLVEPRERARWQGRIAAVFATATVVGPLVGGLLVDHASWRWVFYANLPIGLVALAGLRLLPAGSREPQRRPFDALGAALLVLAASTAMLALSLGITLPLVAVALAAGAAFVARERRAEDPMVPLALLTAPTVRVASAGLFLGTAALFAITVFVPVLLQVTAGMSPTGAGLSLAAMTVGLTVSTTVAGRRVARTGRLRRLPVLGAALMGLALAGLALAAPSAEAPAILAGLVVFGTGFGLTTQLLVVAVQNGVERTRIGVATSTTAFFRAFGGAAGAAALGAVFAGAGPAVGDAVRTTFFVASGVAILAALVLTALPPEVDRDVSGASAA